MTMRFGFELRKVRDELRLTQQQAAVLLDLSPATIANWELGRVSKINAVTQEGVWARVRLYKRICAKVQDTEASISRAVIRGREGIGE